MSVSYDYLDSDRILTMPAILKNFYCITTVRTVLITPTGHTVDQAIWVYGFETIWPPVGLMSIDGLQQYDLLRGDGKVW